MAIAGNLLPANAESAETDGSAWVALINSTNPTRGTGGTLGSHCLSFKSVASGDVQIGLNARVAVTPGVEHWACASVFPPGVGAMSRIEIRWYTTGGTLISTSAGPYVAAPTSSWHQVGTLGTAPANAATADVVIRVLASAANQSWFADRIALIPTTATRQAGNLLPFNAESMEVDASSWTASALASLTVSSVAFSWYQSLLVTSTGAGSVLVTTQDNPAVTPGVEYVAYAYVTPSTAGLSQQVKIIWLDASGTEVGTSSAARTPSTGQWTRCVVVDKAPAGAVTARVGLSPQATAAGQQWVYDRIVLAPASALMTAGNLLPYNAAEIEQDASGWTVTGGTKTQTAEQVFSGSYSLKMVADGGDLVATLAVPLAGVQEGLGYQFAPLVYETVSRLYQTRIEWLNAAGDAVRTRWQSWAGQSGGWRVGTMGDLAPEGAVSVRLSLILPNAPVGEVIYMDRIEWKLGGLTVKAEAAGGGGASITVRGLTTGGPSYKWSLVRVSDRGSAPVRGWAGDLLSQSVTGDIAVAADYEAPLGVPVQWRAVLQDASGVVRLTYLSDPVTLDAGITEAWLKDPGLPQRSVKITVATPMPTWQRPARRGVNQIQGRKLPVVISDVRGGPTGDLTVVTETDADKLALDWVLDTGNVLLLQWPPGWGEEDVYVSVGDISRAPVVDYAEFHDRTWVLPLTVVDRPIGGVTGSADRTWQTVADSGDTWSEALAGAESWLDVYTGA